MTSRDVKYPQRLSNCTACHTDGGYYPVNFDSGVLATTISTGADPASPLDDVNITPNAAVCSSCHTTSDAKLHMEQNGASFDACQGADGTLSVRVNYLRRRRHTGTDYGGELPHLSWQGQNRRCEGGSQRRLTP